MSNRLNGEPHRRFLSLVIAKSAFVFMVVDAVYVYRRGNFLSHFSASSCRGRMEDREDYGDHRVQIEPMPKVDEVDKQGISLTGN